MQIRRMTRCRWSLPLTAVLLLAACAPGSPDLGRPEQQVDNTPQHLADLRYDDKQLQLLMNEIIRQGGHDPQLLDSEMSWMAERERLCTDPMQGDLESCYKAQAIEHRDALERQALLLLVKAPPVQAPPSELKLPGQLVSRDAAVPYQYRLPMAYSQESGILASTTRKGPISISNLANGEVVKTVPSRLRAQSTAGGPGLSLSANGRLLLVTYPSDTELYSAQSGTLIRKLAHRGGSVLEFSSSGRFILYGDGKNHGFVRTVEDSVIPPPQKNDLTHPIAFRISPNRNSLLRWHKGDNSISVVGFTEEGKAAFRKRAKYTLPRSYRGRILNAVLNEKDDSVFVLTNAEIIKVGPGRGKPQVISPLDIDAKRAQVMFSGWYLVLSGDSEVKGKRSVAVVDTATGEYAYPDFGGQNIKALVDTGSKRQFISGSDKGLGIFKLDGGQLAFQRVEQTENAKGSGCLSRGAAEYATPCQHQPGCKQMPQRRGQSSVLRPALRRW